MAKRVKLTDKMVKAAVSDGKSEVCIWDEEVKGFALRIRETGGKSWFLKRGEGRWSLGDANDRKVSDARAEAMAIVAEIAAGRVPGKKPKPQKPRVNDMMRVYMDEHAIGRCSESTQADYQRIIDLHINPVIGTKLVDNVVPRDIDAILLAMKDTPSAANKTISLLKASFAKAMRWGLRSSALGNPCKGAQMHDMNGREEYLEEWELRILLESMDEVAQRTNRWHACQCLKTLAMTGCRRDEIRDLKWSWVDWDRNRINWPTTKTGEGHLTLNVAAISVLRGVQSHDEAHPTKHVFRGEDRKLTLPKSTLYRAWAEVKALAAARGVDPARMKRLRPHDLRHSFATLGLSHGLSLEDVGKLLRHRDTRSTKRYARHLPSAEIALAERSVQFLPVEIAPSILELAATE
jgi:integrase